MLHLPTAFWNVCGISVFICVFTLHRQVQLPGCHTVAGLGRTSLVAPVLTLLGGAVLCIVLIIWFSVWCRRKRKVEGEITSSPLKAPQCEKEELGSTTATSASDAQHNLVWDKL